MALAAAAGVAATAAYLDARWQIRKDLSNNAVTGGVKAAQKYIEQQAIARKLLSYHILEEQARIRPDHLFLIYEGRTWTYKGFFDDVQRVGNYLQKDLGIEPLEIVGLDGGNSPEYLLFWFALDAVGAAPAFINCNLSSAALVHCVKLAESRYLLADADVRDLVGPCEDELSSLNIKTIYYDRFFVSELRDRTPLPDGPRQKVGPFDIRSLIFTSGTTGLPKGTIMATGRELNTGHSVAQLLRLKPSDRFYTCMPLYHGAAHGLLVTPALHAGCTIVLARKFSHKTFWPEIRETKSNIVQYVGELCRYLVNSPPHPLDKVHSVEMIWGNGMRPDVWEAFRQRFNVPVINELYAATDGLGASFNENRGDFTRNAIGVRGLIWHLVLGGVETRVRIDPDSEELARDARGFAIKCKTNEPGETLWQMDPATEEQAFAGYYGNKAASDKRKIRNVFKTGDVWFRSGDLMRLDKEGRLFFVDRLGDTFRWKSENVSTNEVADVCGEYKGIDLCNVYGVLVPNADGRAGSAAIVFSEGYSEDKFDFAGFAHHCLSRLPRYAVPIFLRITEQMESTGTMKMMKGTLKKQGIDPDLVTEKMYWLPPGQSKYVPYTKQDWENIKAGKVKL